MPIIGIDLGTTHSLVGILRKGRPELFSDDNQGVLVPSVVSFDPHGELDSVGHKAQNRRHLGIENVLYSAKRFLGRGLQDVRDWLKILPFDFSTSSDQVIRFKVGTRSYTPMEISGMVLSHLKKMAEKTLGEPVTKAVVTVPAYFNDAQRQATKFAGELAGLEIVRMVNEPTAACLAYGLDRKAKGTVAVYDLGGGTFDVSVLRVQEGLIEVLSTNGNTALGGDDFDMTLVTHLAPEILDVFGSQGPELRGLLLSKAAEVKKKLSSNDQADFNLTWQGKTFSKVITKAEFENCIRGLIDKTKEPCFIALKDAGLTPHDISDVILVGGSTRVPLVKKSVQEWFGREPLCSINPDEVVALGAVVQASILSGQTGNMLLLDVLPLSLGIETMGGVVGKIIHRNSRIPISASENFTTYVDGQTSVDIHVVQGERELVKDNRSLARFQLKGLPPLPAGAPKIEVEFTVDANGILSVRAVELRTHRTASITVNPSYGLTDTEVEKMLEASFEYAEQDFEARFLIEAQTEADSLIRATRRSLESGKHLLSATEFTKIQNAVLELEKTIQTTDRKQIRALIEELGKTTQSFAEQLLNHAVSEALKDRQVLPGGDVP